jgi:predicted HTH domain antitoxin
VANRSTVQAISAGNRRGTEALLQDAYVVSIMGTISTQVPEELEAELEAYLEAKHLDRSTAVRKLLAEGLEEWRRDQALEKLAADTISFSRAAELAGISVWDFAQLAEERDITWIADDHLDAL